MNNARRANALLWTGNVILIIGIVAFAFQFLILQEPKPHGVETPVSVPTGGIQNDPTDTTALGKLANPMLPPKPEGPHTPGAKGPIRLVGTFRVLNDPEGDTAFLDLPARKLNVNAYVGEPIRDDTVGQEVPELAGWKLKSVTPKSALFSTPTGDTTLQLDEITAAAPTIVPLHGFSPLGAAWDPAKFTSRKDAQRSNDNQEYWNIDRKEVDWASANVETLMAGVAVEPYAGGGLKINALPAGGFAAERGLREGDVINSINGQPVESLQKLETVMKGLSRSATTLTVQVNRSGRIYTLSYQVPPAPRR